MEGGGNQEVQQAEIKSPYDIPGQGGEKEGKYVERRDGACCALRRKAQKPLCGQVLRECKASSSWEKPIVSHTRDKD